MHQHQVPPSVAAPQTTIASCIIDVQEFQDWGRRGGGLSSPIGLRLSRAADGQTLEMRAFPKYHVAILRAHANSRDLRAASKGRARARIETPVEADGRDGTVGTACSSYLWVSDVIESYHDVLEWTRRALRSTAF